MSDTPRTDSIEEAYLCEMIDAFYPHQQSEVHKKYFDEVRSIERENQQLRDANETLNMSVQQWQDISDKLRDDLNQCAETSKSISAYACHTSDCYSQKTSPTTYSDPRASTCDCGLMRNMIDYHKAVARLSVQADLKVCE